MVDATVLKSLRVQFSIHFGIWWHIKHKTSILTHTKRTYLSIHFACKNPHSHTQTDTHARAFLSHKRTHTHIRPDGASVGNKTEISLSSSSVLNASLCTYLFISFWHSHRQLVFMPWKMPTSLRWYASVYNAPYSSILFKHNPCHRIVSVDLVDGSYICLYECSYERRENSI